jgi:nickel-dependent lactate racemase
MDLTSSVAPPGRLLEPEVVRQTLRAALSGRFAGSRLLVLIPDHTRSAPLAQLFHDLVEILNDTRQLDFMVALGTHPPLSEVQLFRLVGITERERQSTYRHVGLLNHAWDNPESLIQIGLIPQALLKSIAGDLWHPSLGGDVPVRINRAALAYDHILILGPTFPHEVAGFSGGAKYLFPGISGPEMIHTTHWLGALAGVIATAGIRDTAVRAMVRAAARHLPTPLTLAALIVVDQGLCGVFVGDHEAAWQSAADLSAERHIVWHERAYQRVLSCAPPMYDELWTAAKAMYKLDPVIADGGEIIIYAPHLREVSRAHGEFIHQIGYHVLAYFLEQWGRFGHFPLGVLAHSTHVRGGGRFEDGVEYPRITVTLSSRIPAEECRQLNLGYLDPASINPADWQGREAEGILYVPEAGEMLHRIRGAK